MGRSPVLIPSPANHMKNAMTSGFGGAGVWLIGGGLPGLIFFLFFEPDLQFLKIISSGCSLKKTISKNIFILAVFIT